MRREEEIIGGINGRNLVPVLTAKPEIKKRKVRSDKKHDVKIPVSEQLYDRITARTHKYFNGSKTAYSTEMFYWGLENLVEYPETDYPDSSLMVHIKIDQATYEKIGERAIEWRCSVRKAVHRVFIEAARKKGLESVI